MARAAASALDGLTAQFHSPGTNIWLALGQPNNRVIGLNARTPAPGRTRGPPGRISALHTAPDFGYIRALTGRGEAPSKRPSSTLLAVAGSVRVPPAIKT